MKSAADGTPPDGERLEGDDAASDARTRRLMGVTLAWGSVTLLLLWWFARSYAL